MASDRLDVSQEAWIFRLRAASAMARCAGWHPEASVDATLTIRFGQPISARLLARQRGYLVEHGLASEQDGGWFWTLGAERALRELGAFGWFEWCEAESGYRLTQVGEAMLEMAQAILDLDVRELL